MVKWSTRRSDMWVPERATRAAAQHLGLSRSVKANTLYAWSHVRAAHTVSRNEKAAGMLYKSEHWWNTPTGGFTSLCRCCQSSVNPALVNQPTHSSSPVGTNLSPQQNPLLASYHSAAPSPPAAAEYGRLRRALSCAASRPRSSEMLPRRLGGLSAAVSGRLRRGLSTGAAASRPPWAMIYHAILVKSPGLRASFKLAEPTCASHILVPDHLVDPAPRPAPDSDTMSLLGGVVRAVSGDGLLLLDFRDERATAPIVGYRGTSPLRRLMGFSNMDPDTTRFVCNPLSGQLFRLPDIDGTKKTSSYKWFGILTRSERLHGPPDRYAVAELVEDNEAMEGSFLMRRFLSPTRGWDKLVGLPSPLPVARRSHKNHDHEVLAFAGRLWWVDVSWGAITADPFSDRPELRFVELPKGSLTEPVEGNEIRTLGRYRRMGVSEGRLHYAEVSQEEPFLLSTFVLDDDGSWTLQHRVALNRFLSHPSDLCEEGNKPRIGVVDPLNASIMHLTIGNNAISVDMIRQKVIGCCVVGEGAGPSMFSTGFLKPCVLPLWLGSSQIPSAGNRANVKSKTLSDVLVRVDSDEKN